MKTGSIALLTLLMLPAATAGAETASQVFQQVSPSVVVVLTYNSIGKVTELGSGVKLANGGVATNCHVLKDGVAYRVRYRDKLYTASLDKADWNHDVCLLGVPDLPAPPATLGSTKTLQIGAPVYAIGTPEGLQLTLSEGIVSSLRPADDGSYIQTTAAISPGSSGGGLFDDHGHLLGLTSFFMKEGQQLNFALPVEWIEALPNHVTPLIASRKSEVQWLNQVIALEDDKNWHELLSVANAWVKAQPHSASAWYALGYAYDHNGQYAQGIDAYRRAAQINPKDATIWNNLGTAYGENGQFAQSIEPFRQALQINPRLAQSWFGLGLSYSYTGRQDQAMNVYQHLKTLNPSMAHTLFDAIVPK